MCLYNAYNTDYNKLYCIRLDKFPNKCSDMFLHKSICIPLVLPLPLW